MSGRSQYHSGSSRSSRVQPKCKTGDPKGRFPKEIIRSMTECSDPRILIIIIRHKKKKYMVLQYQPFLPKVQSAMIYITVFDIPEIDQRYKSICDEIKSHEDCCFSGEYKLIYDGARLFYQDTLKLIDDYTKKEEECPSSYLIDYKGKFKLKLSKIKLSKMKYFPPDYFTDIKIYHRDPQIQERTLKYREIDFKLYVTLLPQQSYCVLTMIQSDERYELYSGDVIPWIDLKSIIDEQICSIKSVKT